MLINEHCDCDCDCGPVPFAVTHTVHYKQITNRRHFHRYYINDDNYTNLLYIYKIYYKFYLNSSKFKRILKSIRKRKHKQKTWSF